MKFLQIFMNMLLLGWNLAAKRSLYEQERDQVVVLDIDNFYDHILNQSHGWVIQFYSSWCGHCHKFAPTFKNVVKEIFVGNTLIKPAVIDCANEKNTPICRQLEVDSYPTIRVFPAHLKKDEYKGEEITPTSETADMIDRILTTLKANFPELLINGHFSIFKSPADALKGSPIVDTFYNLVFIGSNSKLSEQIRQYSSVLVNNRLLVVSKADTHALQKYQVKKLPSLLYFKDPSSKPTDLTPNATDVTSILKMILNVEHNGTLPAWLSLADAVFRIDLEKSLYYTINHEVFRHKQLTGPALESLKNFIAINYEYNPVSKPIKLYLKKILDWLSSKKTVDTSSMEAYLKEVGNEQVYLPDYSSWVGCKGSLPVFRGYPCSLWTSFHVMLTNAYLLEKENSYRNKRVLNSIHGYIKYFFSCKECSKNFQYMYNQTISEVSSAKESILWLWRSHNKVNKRLSGHESDDPLHSKYQFPSSKLCPYCNTGDDQILKFLLDFYSEQNIQNESPVLSNEIHKIFFSGSQSISAKVINNKEASSVDTGKKISLKLSKLDAGMAIFLYFISGSILILAYYYFVVRSRRKRFHYANSGLFQKIL